MKNKFIPQKYELCSLFSIEELGTMGVEMMLPKERHYICHSKKNRVKKKYSNRILARTEAYLQFVREEAKKRGNADFLYKNDVVMTIRKGRLLGFSVCENADGQNKSAAVDA